MIAPDETAALYRTYDTPFLVTLRHCFVSDRKAAKTDTSRAFIDGRLAVINQILRERDKEVAHG